MEFAELVKFEHTIFALPFALSAMILACAPGVWPNWVTMLCVLGAMVGGRTFAMAANRLIDAEIDGANPRTKNRSLPAGRLGKTEVWLLMAASAALLIGATWPLPEICRELLPVAFGILLIYSYVKRFSSLAHLVLGIALGSSAVGGWLAVSGQLGWLPVNFGFAIVFWVAGFDIIYACQDVDFDREARLNSLPANYGIKQALFLSRLFHALCIALLTLFAISYPHTGPGLWTAIALTAGMLIYEHVLIRGNSRDTPIRLEKVNEAFFNINGKISISVFILVLIDHLISGGL